MARRPTIRKEQILEAARTLFMEQGYHASTAAIARAAGISEGSIFKKFSSKGALFKEAMGDPEFAVDLQALVGVGHPRAQLRVVALELQAFYRQLIPRLMHRWSHGHRMSVLSCEVEGNSGPTWLMGRVAAFIEAERDLGRIHTDAPEVAARMLVASMHYWVFLETLGVSSGDAEESQVYVTKVIDTLWKGLAPRASGAGEDL